MVKIRTFSKAISLFLQRIRAYKFQQGKYREFLVLIELLISNLTGNIAKIQRIILHRGEAELPTTYETNMNDYDKNLTEKMQQKPKIVE